MDLTLLGPLAPLAGTWEGDEGIDLAFSYSEAGAKEIPFRERTTFEPFGPVVNGPQQLYGLDYRTTAWPIGAEEPFHMEVGYWLWDAAASQVMRCFMVPRGATILAGGTAAPDATVLEMKAEVGSETFGVLSNPPSGEGRALRALRADGAHRSRRLLLLRRRHGLAAQPGRWPLPPHRSQPSASGLIPRVPGDREPHPREEPCQRTDTDAGSIPRCETDSSSSRVRRGAT